MREDRRANPLARHRVPAPPPELEARVEAAVRLAGADELSRRDWIDALWENRAARLLWATASTALLLANLGVARRVWRPASPPQVPIAVALASALDVEASALAATPALGFGVAAGARAEWRRQVLVLLESDRLPEAVADPRGALERPAPGRRAETRP